MNPMRKGWMGRYPHVSPFGLVGSTAKSTIRVDLWLVGLVLAAVVGFQSSCSSRSKSKHPAKDKGASSVRSGEKDTSDHAGRESGKARKGDRIAGNWHPVKAVEQVYKPGTERTFVFYGPEKKGKRAEIGWNWCRYEGKKTVEGLTGLLLHCKVHMDTRKMGSSFGTVTESESRLLLDERGVPKRMWGRSNMGGAFDMRFGSGKVRIQSGGKKLDVPWPGALPLLTNNHPVHEELILALMEPKAGKKLSFDLFSPSGALVIPYQASVEADRGAGVQKPPPLRISNGLREVIVWRNGRIVEASVAGGLMRYEATDRPEPKLTAMGSQVRPVYHRPKDATWDDKEVVISGRDVPISGSLRVPRGKGHKPAVLFISGSGSQDRNGLAGLIDIGTWQVLDALARAGFVVLSTDDRGMGKTPVGKTLNIGYWDLVADAEAALKFLAARPEVRKDRVFILGHSEGCMTAVILAAKHPDLVRGIALMAAPARNLADIMRDQMIHLTLKGIPKDKAARRLARFDAVVAALRAGKRPSKDVMTDTEWKASSRSIKWLTDHVKLKYGDYVRKVRCPVLICQGSKDVQVSPDKDAKPLAAMLEKAGNKDVTLKMFAGLDHLFKKEPGESSMKSYMDRKRPVDRAFISFLTHWLQRHAK